MDMLSTINEEDEQMNIDSPIKNINNNNNRQSLLSPIDGFRRRESTLLKPIGAFEPRVKPETREKVRRQTEFIQKVNAAILEMKQFEQISKVVLARCKEFKINEEIDINVYFLNLCLSYPNAFVYAVSSSITGTWIAATPELLLKASNNEIETTAIAGTKLYENDSAWGKKEIDEHHQVELFIENLIQKHQLELTNKEGPKSIVSGHLCHLWSYYKIANNKGVLDSFLNELNPTPAVGGLPSKNAIDFIANNENLDRKFYSGFVGIKSNKLTQLYVNIRCMEIFKTHVNAYAGCGITVQSNAESEWKETEYKLQTVLKFLT
jgi:isochorismate synthase